MKIFQLIAAFVQQNVYDDSSYGFNGYRIHSLFK